MLLYDDTKRLEDTLGEEAASAIVHVLERADENWKRELATKADLQEVRNDLIQHVFDVRAEIAVTENRLSERIADVRVEVQSVRVEMHAMKNELIKWMIGGFIAFGALICGAMAFFR